MVEYFKSFARHGLAFLGGVLVAKGVVGQDAVDAFAQSSTEVIGGALTYGLSQLLSWNRIKKIF